MSRRTKIAKHLKEAWDEVITECYCTGQLNTEFDLQANLYAALKSRLCVDGKPKRHIFMEVGIELAEGGFIRPDIIVCSDKEVLSVIEIKFGPRVLPVQGKDMQSISSFASDASITITNERYRGKPLPPKKFTVSDSVLFVWAGVHAGDAIQSEVWKSDEFKNHLFLELHAVTHDSEDPSVVSFTNVGAKPVAEVQAINGEQHEAL